MVKGKALAIVAVLALAGCDRLGFASGPAADAGQGNSANPARGDAAAKQDAPADAGVTRSRSLAGLVGGAPVSGGKDPGAVPASAQGMIQPDLLIGRWSDDGSCKDLFEFLPDGTFRTATGVEGQWSLAGETLTLAGPEQSLDIRLRAVEPDRLIIANPDGSGAQSIRC